MDEYNFDDGVLSSLPIITENFRSVGCPQLVFLSKRRQLMCLGSYNSRSMFVLNVDDSIEWHLLSGVEMPFEINNIHYQIHLGFKNVIFVFQYGGDSSGCIWCLDLLEMCWHKSLVTIPSRCVFDLNENSACIVKNRVNIHIVNIVVGYNYKVSLYDMLPKAVLKGYKKHVAQLVEGFVKRYEVKRNVRFIPIVIQRLIINFFPL